MYDTSQRHIEDIWEHKKDVSALEMICLVILILQYD